LKYIVITTGGLPEKPSGSSMLAAPKKKQIAKKQYMLKNRQDKNGKKWRENAPQIT